MLKKGNNELKVANHIETSSPRKIEVELKHDLNEKPVLQSFMKVSEEMMELNHSDIAQQHQQLKEVKLEVSEKDEMMDLTIGN